MASRTMAPSASLACAQGIPALRARRSVAVRASVAPRRAVVPLAVKPLQVRLPSQCITNPPRSHNPLGHTSTRFVQRIGICPLSPLLTGDIANPLVPTSYTVKKGSRRKGEDNFGFLFVDPTFARSRDEAELNQRPRPLRVAT